MYLTFTFELLLYSSLILIRSFWFPFQFSFLSLTHLRMNHDPRRQAIPLAILSISLYLSPPFPSSIYLITILPQNALFLCTLLDLCDLYRLITVWFLFLPRYHCSLEMPDCVIIGAQPYLMSTLSRAEVSNGNDWVSAPHSFPLLKLFPRYSLSNFYRVNLLFFKSLSNGSRTQVVACLLCTEKSRRETMPNNGRREEILAW